ncbi:putative neural-cadherin 2 [Penaeus monodon]|uniref:putative neural-cadherin 2 n=1 Tax=Penaeus monodon TaxID=6687 RepID=UPI0018A74FFD|nr:putative neural-cadherin 2 [Penaeus monodon]
MPPIVLEDIILPGKSTPADLLTMKLRPTVKCFIAAINKRFEKDPMFCIDDLRLSGRPLPLPASSNSTSWGQVSTFKNTDAGCTSPDACVNTTCGVPLTCTSTWGKATCGCGPGRELVGRACKDVDECLWQPCLHGGSCYNMRPGFLCVCGPGHSGHYCQWTDLDSPPYHLKGTMAVVTLALSTIFVGECGYEFCGHGSTGKQRLVRYTRLNIEDFTRVTWSKIASGIDCVKSSTCL